MTRISDNILPPTDTSLDYSCCSKSGDGELHLSTDTVNVSQAKIKDFTHEEVNAIDDSKLSHSVEDHLVQHTNVHEALFKHLPIGIIFQKNNGMITLANPAAQKILGYNERQLKGITKRSFPWKTFDKNWAPFPYPKHPGVLALATGKPQRGIVMAMVRDSGDTLWIKANSEIVVDAITGAQRGVLTSFSDITEERNINIALKFITDRSQIAIESAEMGVWDWIPDDSLMIWDRRLFELHGYGEHCQATAEEVWRKSLHPDDATIVKKILRDLVKNPGNQKLDYRVIWPDGSIHHLRSQARIMKNHEGTVNRIIGVTHDITRDVLAEQKLWDLAYRDALTGLFSRAGLSFRLSRSVVRAINRKSPLAVMMVGLKRFKEVNENYGISVGDQVLGEVAQRMKLIIGDNDTLSRVGGDEFVLVLESGCSPEAIEDFAERFKREVLAPVYLDQGLVVTLDAAIGVSFSPDNGRDAVTLQARAGMAMHHSKIQNRCVLYNGKMSEEIARKYHLKYQLQHAVKSGEFQLYYQPIVDLKELKVVGCEALIRWKDGSGKFVSPMEFIPVVEESGWIQELGSWINSTAVKQWKLWQTLEPNLEYVSINVSPHQLENPEFVNELVELIDEHQVKPNNIQLEITEGTFLKESLNADSVLKKLADYGFRLAIDDFGTGYSSLAYLKRFNVDVIKIDRSFIIDIETDQSDRDIVSAILAMNKKLGFKTLVEGIETDMQSTIICELGCDSAQGYLYGRPTFADEFAELYIKNNTLGVQQLAG
ncbi:MAG: diguanylate cyclase (GGDEF)-like protein/PAS domain S-box-containing protein [Lentisphaeria bacterium]|jgi:diguanylate cyclase (GGDEF)-like protein/PAS domain S-box-containing protein